MTTTKGNVRENHVVEFEEGRRVAWKPAEPGGEPLGHLWRWVLEPLEDGRTRVTHTYDWTHLRDEKPLRPGPGDHVGEAERVPRTARRARRGRMPTA